MAVNVKVLDASRQLRDAGFPGAQADAILTAVAAVMPDDLVTKGVLVSELKAFERRLTIRLLATVGGGAGIVLAGVGVATAFILAARLAGC